MDSRFRGNDEAGLKTLGPGFRRDDGGLRSFAMAPDSTRTRVVMSRRDGAKGSPIRRTYPQGNSTTSVRGTIMTAAPFLPRRLARTSLLAAFGLLVGISSASAATFQVRCDDCSVLTPDDIYTKQAAVVGLQGFGADVHVGDGVRVLNEGGHTYSCSDPLFQRFKVLRVPVTSTNDIQNTITSVCEPLMSPPAPHSMSGWALTEWILMSGTYTPVFNCHFNSICS